MSGTENPLNERVASTYDAAQRLVGTADPLGRTSTLGYDADGQRTSGTTPLQVSPLQTTTYAFNARGESTSMTDAMNPGNTISYEYDANGNPVRLINRNNGAFVSTYYGNNQLATFKTPSLKTTTTTYKLRGMVATVTEPSGQRNHLRL